MRYTKNLHPFLLVLAMLAINACSPVGIIAGTGASLGISHAQEGGIESSASDFRISAFIKDKWFKYDIDTFSKLNLTVDQGRVLITGVVDNPDDRVEAVRLAWQVDGVKQVINEIKIADSEGFPGYVRDTWITTRLRTALTFTADIKSINYTLDTVQGIVYIMGTAQDEAELDRVIEVARTIPHVRQVISYVKMRGEEPVEPNPHAEP